MNDTIQIIVGIIFLALVYMLTRYIVAKKIMRASRGIVDELQGRGALDPEHAVQFSWAKPDWLRFGLRDYRPKALEGLIGAGIVGRTQEGLYYLAKSLDPLQEAEALDQD
ncbi:MAG: hypothetical protein V1797_02000 [Pseudomonadota bacterium]